MIQKQGFFFKISRLCPHVSPNCFTFCTSILLLVLLSIRSDPTSAQEVRVIKIGAIFEGTDPQLEIVFRQTVDLWNLDRYRLPNTRLEAQVTRINHRDSFHAAKLACQLIESGCWAIFGPQSPDVGWFIRSIADNLHVPNFQFNWDFRSYLRHKTYPTNMTINLHPEPSSLSQAFADVVESRSWKSFTLIYEEDGDLIKVCILFAECSELSSVCLFLLSGR